MPRRKKLFVEGSFDPIELTEDQFEDVQEDDQESDTAELPLTTQPDPEAQYESETSEVYGEVTPEVIVPEPFVTAQPIESKVIVPEQKPILPTPAEPRRPRVRPSKRREPRNLLRFTR